MLQKKSVLIIGSGGREHALGWKFSQSPNVSKIYFAPGNGGTQQIGENVAINVMDNGKLVTFAKENNIDLTFVGPEIPLANGVVDAFENEGFKIFGPNKKAAQLESNKAFACDFMEHHSIPYPKSETYANVENAKKYIQKIGATNSVIKASGLAAGKGVILPETEDEAMQTIDDIMQKKIFGDSGSEVVIQERINGPEISIIAFTDGKTVVPLPPSQDHKRIFDNDKGPNTGGMGAYAPVPFVTKEQLEDIKKNILEKTIEGLKKDGIVFKGILYAGLMMTSSGPKVLEYNVRFGDPETEPLIMLLDSDLYELSVACIEERLTPNMVKTKSGSAICVVLAAKGYPSNYEKGIEINGLASIKDPSIQVFHAGTTKKNDHIITSGGRVLAVTGYGDTIQNAIQKTYSAIGKNGVYFDGMQYRKDIAWQAK